MRASIAQRDEERRNISLNNPPFARPLQTLIMIDSNIDYRLLISQYITERSGKFKSPDTQARNHSVTQQFRWFERN